METPIEYVDLVDQTGSIRMRHVERHKADQHLSAGLYMRIVIAVLFNKQREALVQLRGEGKTYANHRDHVCGAVMSGEDPLTAAYREAREEVRVTPTRLLLVHEGVNIYNRYALLYAGLVDSGPTEPLNTNEVARAWFAAPSVLRGQAESPGVLQVHDFLDELNAAEQVLDQLLPPLGKQ